MEDYPKDRMFIIILDNGKRLPAVYESNNSFLVGVVEFSIFGNDFEVCRVPSQIGIPVSWEELQPKQPINRLLIDKQNHTQVKEYVMNTEKQITKILQVYTSSSGAVRPHFFLTGATGSGKTHTITKLADEFGINIINVNSAQLTSEGIAGNSISKALTGLADYQNTPVIVFFDEFDKAIASDAEVTSGTVQQEVLKLLEDDTTEVFGNYGKYNRVQVSNVLFVFAGSFAGTEFDSLSDLLDHNVRPELLGRVGLHFHVERANLEELLNLVKKSKLIEEYCQLFSGITQMKAVSDISNELEAQFVNNVIGIRIINSLTHQYFINGGFTNVTKRREVLKTAKVNKELTFG